MPESTPTFGLNHLLALTKDLKEQSDHLEEDKKRLQDLEESLAQKKQTYESLIENNKNLKRELEQEKIEIEDERANLELELEGLKTAKLKEWIDAVKENHQQQQQLLQDEFIERRNQILKTWNTELEEEQKRLNERAQKLSTELAKLDQKAQDLFAQEQRLKQEQQSLEAEVERRVSERKSFFETEEERLKEEIQDLEAKYQDVQYSLQQVEHEDRWANGRSFGEVLKENQDLQRIITEMKEKLANSSSENITDDWKRLGKENETLVAQNQKLREENNQLKTTYKDQVDYQIEIATLKSKLDLAKTENEQAQIVIKTLNEQLESLRNAKRADYNRCRDMIERRQDPFFKPDSKPIRNKDLKELDWLNDLHQKIADYGYVFSKRILFAFHTALKIRDWSPITVLAGVSGTGKSKLPELYSTFGGLLFHSEPVQPNWDSSQSMLGFYNSLDATFEAKPILNILAQNQYQFKPDDYLGTRDHLSMILLDEMNLAHIELYFADFLSKLEERKGKSRTADNLPFIDIKIGSDSYKLSLDRNVLWVGTMNQDETTKSLSDKVLDRGTVIYFPRPKKMERLSGQKKPPTGITPLHRSTFANWCTTDLEKIDFASKTDKYKRWIEEINSYLSNIGRALGHRVWQATEFYMANHPEVLHAIHNLKEGETTSPELDRALKLAFEDQLVQKVMPKLRGIETQGHGWDQCLRLIYDFLKREKFEIEKDFNIARTTEFGQFLWRSAEYLDASSN